MPPFPGMPYGPAPSYCFPVMEFSMYILFILCLVHAGKQGIRHVSYLFGGLAFGLILEYVNVVSNLGYTYGKFMVMFGHTPQDIPLCIGVGWSIIMYTARLFSDSFQLPLWAAAATDTLLALSIDLSMDTVAYRLHMWHWNWSSTGLNPLTAQWFGVPFGNFFGWQMVVFFYSSFSRLLERALLRQKKRGHILFTCIPLIAVLLSQICLYVMLMYVDDYLRDKFGITSLHRFITFLLILIVLAVRGFFLRRNKPLITPFITCLVPLWFHLFFFTWLFWGGFYKENSLLVTAAILNIIMGISIHIVGFKKQAAARPALA
jgi:uncharacterized membrane protein